jgi:hypothetical protein
MEKYGCAFRGRRDYDPAPLALAETGLLNEFITDAYALPMLRRAANAVLYRWREKILFRHVPGIPDERVQCLWGTTVLEHVRHRLGCLLSVTFAKPDKHFSIAAARRVARYRSYLFLYSPYAWEAFVARYPHTPPEVLANVLPGGLLVLDDAYRPSYAPAREVLREWRRLEFWGLGPGRRGVTKTDIYMCPR